LLAVRAVVSVRGVSEGRPWHGSFFACCSCCRRASFDPHGDGWHFHEDEDELLAFCPSCARTELGATWSSPPPLAVCPACHGRLEPQPVGGWVCEDHGLVVAPRLVARS
jgi:hypothetical protein